VEVVHRLHHHLHHQSPDQAEISTYLVDIDR
jgi:hypothetical protein